MTQSWVFWVLAGYLCGSVPFGWLIGRAKGVDLRRCGSGNVGSTNAGRVLGKQWGWLCFGLDTFKGTAPVLAAGWSMGLTHQILTQPQAWQWLAVAASTILGHIFPVWLRFRGGKGVATGLGSLVGFWPLLSVPVLAAMATWLIVVAVSRYVSLASIAAAAAVPLFLAASVTIRQQPWGQAMPFLLTTGILAVLVIARHRSNVARVLSGTEPKLGQPCQTTASQPSDG